ncbi:MAG: hypothetical protein KDK91_29565, partial [Gammaproteobacteria bacterium]|nr:hypothetical protein [Gammaproteobacteria bacterium]
PPRATTGLSRGGLGGLSTAEPLIPSVNLFSLLFPRSIPVFFLLFLALVGYARPWRAAHVIQAFRIPDPGR